MTTHIALDQLYGPLNIPDYCWPIIDTPEFQRLRYIGQLAGVSYVYPSANYVCIEHSLGCAHLTHTLMRHLNEVQPELGLTKEIFMSAVIGALCHDLGIGPYSHIFDSVMTEYFGFKWSKKEMSARLLRHIVNKYHIELPEGVLDVACGVITGKKVDNYPEWIFNLVRSDKCPIDLNQLDYLSRDMNRTINTNRFEYDVLIQHCRVFEGKLSWRESEIPVIERVLFNRNDMHARVYKHKVVQAIEIMLQDILIQLNKYNDSDQLFIEYEDVINDPEQFWKLDDRIMTIVESGQYGKKAMTIAEHLSVRKIYKYVGEMRYPSGKEGETSPSQKSLSSTKEEIQEFLDEGIRDKVKFRITRFNFRYGLGRSDNPLMMIPFWNRESKTSFYLDPRDISCINPTRFSETILRVYIKDKDYVNDALAAFQSWKQKHSFHN